MHLIDCEWDLKSFSLDEDVACAITNVLDNWNLSFKNLIATTTDNGSNVVAAFQILDSLRISCFGHNLDLAIKKGLNISQVQRAIIQCHSLVEMFHRSWKKSRDLSEKQHIPYTRYFLRVLYFADNLSGRIFAFKFLLMAYDRRRVIQIVPLSVF